MKNGVKNVLDVISKGGDMITDVAKKGENLLVGAVATLGLDLYSVGLHKGFLNIYLSTRIQMHRIVRKELMRSPAPVYVTGHSMGGACASLATLDISINTLPRVKAYLESTEVHKNTQIPITMYNFGSPRVGDKAYRKLYNSTCPASFRVVCDGDVVTGVPKNLQGFKHACTQILIDANALGNIIIDPSFVERWLRLRKGISVKAHLMQTYRSGLEAVIRCTTLVRAMAKQVEDGKKTKDELVRDLMNLANEGRILDADTSSSLFPKIEEEHSVESPVHAEEDVKYPRSSLESPRNSEIENGGEKRNSLRSSSHRGSRGSIDFVNSVSMGSFG
jgi:hypothetical protein